LKDEAHDKLDIKVGKRGKKERKKEKRGAREKC